MFLLYFLHILCCIIITSRLSWRHDGQSTWKHPLSSAKEVNFYAALSVDLVCVPMFLLPLLQVVSISGQPRSACCKFPEPEPWSVGGASLSCMGASLWTVFVLFYGDQRWHCVLCFQATTEKSSTVFQSDVPMNRRNVHHRLAPLWRFSQFSVNPTVGNGQDNIAPENLAGKICSMINSAADYRFCQNLVRVVHYGSAMVADLLNLYRHKLHSRLTLKNRLSHSVHPSLHFTGGL